MNFARCILDVTFVGCFGRLPCFKRISLVSQKERSLLKGVGSFTNENLLRTVA